MCVDCNTAKYEKKRLVSRFTYEKLVILISNIHTEKCTVDFTPRPNYLRRKGMFFYYAR